MKRRKLSIIVFLIQVCNLELVNSKHHRGPASGNGLKGPLYNNIDDTKNYIGKNNVFKLDKDLVTQRNTSSKDGSCRDCHRIDRGEFSDNKKNLYNRDSYDDKNGFFTCPNESKGKRKGKKHEVTHKALNYKRDSMMKLKDSFVKLKGPEQNPYGYQDPKGYSQNSPNPGQGYPQSSGPAQGGYSGPDQGYGSQPSNQYVPNPQGQYAPSQGPPESYTPEQYPDQRYVPQQGQDYSKPYSPDMNPAPGQMPQDQPYSNQMYPDQYGNPPYGSAPYTSSNVNDDEDDVHNSWKCRLIPFFFPECGPKKDKLPQQNQYAPPPQMSPVSQQYCNIYGTSDLNLSDFDSNSDQWLVVNQNNSLRVTSNSPVQSRLQSLELKGNLCNKANISCTLQLGENSAAGLSMRGKNAQKILVELNSLNKTVSLKEFNGQTTQVLLETPYSKLNPNFLHLVNVNDGGFDGNISVSVDGDTVLTKRDFPTQVTGTMGLYISSGNATFGNLSVTPVSS